MNEEVKKERGLLFHILIFVLIMIGCTFVLSTLIYFSDEILVFFVDVITSFINWYKDIYYSLSGYWQVVLGVSTILAIATILIGIVFTIGWFRYKDY